MKNLKNKKTSLASKARWLKIYWLASCGVLAFLILTPEIRELVSKVINGEWSSINFHHFFLYLATGYLIVVWLWSTRYELDLLCEWLDLSNYVPPTAFIQAGICIILAIFGCLLFLSVKNLTCYIGLFTTYTLSNIFIGGIHTLSEVGGALNSSEKKLEALKNSEQGKVKYKINAYEKALKAIRLHWVNNLQSLQYFNGNIRHYVLPKWYLWLKNRYFLRLLITFIASFIAFIISLIAIRKSSQMLETLSYWVILITIIVSEVWILAWRLRLYAEIRKATELLEKNNSLKV
ncbi:hypothetical protein ES707_19710 [subsurface metagenome]